MPPARFLLVIGLVIAAAALTLWGGALVVSAAGLSSSLMVLPLVTAALALALRRRP